MFSKALIGAAMLAMASAQQEPEVRFLVLEKLVVGVGVDFLGSIIEV